MHGRKNNLVGTVGFEPTILAARNFKSRVYPSSTTCPWGEGGVSKSRPLGPQPSALPLSYQHHKFC